MGPLTVKTPQAGLMRLPRMQQEEPPSFCQQGERGQPEPCLDSPVSYTIPLASTHILWSLRACWFTVFGAQSPEPHTSEALDKH